jgi:hypothetical protein
MDHFIQQWDHNRLRDIIVEGGGDYDNDHHDHDHYNMKYEFLQAL